MPAEVCSPDIMRKQSLNPLAFEDAKHFNHIPKRGTMLRILLRFSRTVRQNLENRIIQLRLELWRQSARSKSCHRSGPVLPPQFGNPD